MTAEQKKALMMFVLLMVLAYALGAWTMWLAQNVEITLR